MAEHDGFPWVKAVATTAAAVVLGVGGAMLARKGRSPGTGVEPRPVPTRAEIERVIDRRVGGDYDSDFVRRYADADEDERGRWTDDVAEWERTMEAALIMDYPSGIYDPTEEFDGVNYFSIKKVGKWLRKYEPIWMMPGTGPKLFVWAPRKVLERMAATAFDEVGADEIGIREDWPRTGVRGRVLRLWWD